MYVLVASLRPTFPVSYRPRCPRRQTCSAKRLVVDPECLVDKAQALARRLLVGRYQGQPIYGDDIGRPRAPTESYPRRSRVPPNGWRDTAFANLFPRKVRALVRSPTTAWCSRIGFWWYRATIECMRRPRFCSGPTRKLSEISPVLARCSGSRRGARRPRFTQGRMWL